MERIPPWSAVPKLGLLLYSWRRKGKMEQRALLTVPRVVKMGSVETVEKRTYFALARVRLRLKFFFQPRSCCHQSFSVGKSTTATEKQNITRTIVCISSSYIDLKEGAKPERLVRYEDGKQTHNPLQELCVCFVQH
jgi:hypothetical protein